MLLDASANTAPQCYRPPQCFLFVCVLKLRRDRHFPALRRRALPQKLSILFIVPSCSYYMNTHSSLPRIALLFHDSPLVIGTLVIFNNVSLRPVPFTTFLDQTHPFVLQS